jgi:hypothetical protein
MGTRDYVMQTWITKNSKKLNIHYIQGIWKAEHLLIMNLKEFERKMT